MSFISFSLIAVRYIFLPEQDNWIILKVSKPTALGRNQAITPNWIKCGILHRGLGVWFRNLGLEILICQKWFGGLLGTPLEGIPPLNPQGALSGGRYSFRKSAWRWNKGWEGVKNQSFFCPKNIQYVPRVDEKLTSMKNPAHTCPKSG